MLTMLAHALSTHLCFLVPGPPNLTLSLQFRHCPQSSRIQPWQTPHRRARRLLRPSPAWSLRSLTICGCKFAARCIFVLCSAQPQQQEVHALTHAHSTTKRSCDFAWAAITLSTPRITYFVAWLRPPVWKLWISFSRPKLLLLWLWRRIWMKEKWMLCD